MVASLGFSTPDAALVSVCITLGGVFGGLGVGFATGRIGLKATTLLFTALGALFTARSGQFRLTPNCSGSRPSRPASSSWEG